MPQLNREITNNGRLPEVSRKIRYRWTLESYLTTYSRIKITDPSQKYIRIYKNKGKHLQFRNFCLYFWSSGGRDPEFGFLFSLSPRIYYNQKNLSSQCGRCLGNWIPTNCGLSKNITFHKNHSLLSLEEETLLLWKDSNAKKEGRLLPNL